MHTTVPFSLVINVLVGMFTGWLQYD